MNNPNENERGERLRLYIAAQVQELKDQIDAIECSPGMSESEAMEALISLRNNLYDRSASIKRHAIKEGVPNIVMSDNPLLRDAIAGDWA